MNSDFFVLSACCCRSKVKNNSSNLIEYRQALCPNMDYVLLNLQEMENGYM